MFFSFSLRKITNMLMLFGLLAFAVISFLAADNRWKLQEASGVYLRSAKENLAYWWRSRVFTGGSAQALVYQSDATTARSIPVLVYHGLPDEGSGDNPFSPERFAAQMNVLKNAGWKTITLSQFEDFIRGNATLPERSFLLTFDDGRKDTFYPSDPVLKDLGFNAVMFAITKKSISPTSDQSTYYLSQYELTALEKSGRWEVESHGRDSHDWYYVDGRGAIGHYFSNLLWQEDEQRIETEEAYRKRTSSDLANSKSDLERVLNTEIIAFAYPFSDYGQDTVNFSDAKQILAEEVPAYYKLAFYQVWPGSADTFNYPDPARIMMKRIEPQGDWTSEYLLQVLESGISKDVPYSSYTFGDEWVKSWGDVSFGETLSLKANSKTTGASTALNGSWWWQNYTFTTDVEWKKGANVVLAARRGDDRNYFGCNFSRNGKVYVKTIINGESSNLVDTNYTLPYYNGINLGISVDDSNVKCLVDGMVVLNAPGVNVRIPRGGIGIEVWNPKEDNADVVFDNIRVYSN